MNKSVISGNIFLSLLLLICSAIPARSVAQESWKSTAWQLGPGSTYLYDDYISPISYTAHSLRLSLEFFKPIGHNEEGILHSDPDIWFNQFSMHLLPAVTKTQSGHWLFHAQAEIQNTTFRQVAGDVYWYLRAGGFLALRGGGRLTYQSSNNPGSADIMTDIGAAVMAGYRFQLWGKNLHLRYLGNFPLAGLAFSPEYTQSYYEIFYLGNYEKTMKFTSLHNKKQWMQQLSLDIPLSRKQSSLRLSYWNEGRITKMNNLNIRVISDQFSIGYIRYFKVL